MNVACDYEAPMQMLTTEKYIAARTADETITQCSFPRTRFDMHYRLAPCSDCFFEILASAYGPGPLIILNEDYSKLNMLLYHIWKAYCSRSI